MSDISIHPRSSILRPRADAGGALVMAVFLIAVMVALSSALMTSAHQQSKLSHSSMGRTRVLYVAEAGIHAGAANLYAGGTGAVGSAAAPLSFGGGEYYVTAVDHGNDSFTLTCNAVYDGERQAIEATIAVDYISLFTKGLFGDIDLGASGTVFTDSYDSTAGTYASQATNTYTASDGTVYTYAGTDGDLGSNGDITLRGGVVVMGDAVPGPGHTVNQSGTGIDIYGSTTPATAPTPIPTVTYAPPVPSLGPLKNTSLVLPSGTFRYDSVSLSGSETLTISGDTTLYVDGDWKQSGQSEVIVAPGATLKIHHNGGTFGLTGGGLVNMDQETSQFQLYSSASTVDIGGNSDFYGAVYAPNALVSPSGTGVLFGSFVGREVYISGTADFHYDEDLANLTESRVPSRVEIVSYQFVRPTP